MKLIDGGYSSQPAAEHLDRLFAVLGRWRHSPRLALLLSVRTRRKRASVLSKNLRNRLYREARLTVAFPEPGNANREERTGMILDWLDRMFVGSAETAGPYRIDPDSARLALVCVMEEPSPTARAAGIYRILSGCTQRGHAQDEASAVEVDLSGFYSEVAAIFGTERTNIKRILSGLGLAAPALAANEEHRKEIDRLRGSLKQLTERVVRRDAELSERDNALAAARSRIDELERAIAEKDRLLSDAERRCESLDDHWTEVNQQQLARQAHAVKSDLDHELREVRLSLDRQNPNVGMALERVRRMERIVARLGEDHESDEI
jgi:hypothetical protein